MVSSALKKKFFRGIKGNFIQLISIILMLILGVAIYIGIDSTWRSLDEYKNSRYAEEDKADIEVVITPTSLIDFNSKNLDKIKHITSFETLFIGEATIKGFESRELLFNAVDKNFNLNQLSIVEGTFKLEGNYCVLDKSFADENNISIGDELTLEFNSLEKKFLVSGLAKSSSYIYLTPDSTTVIPNHKDYGFIYLNQEDFTYFTNDFQFINKIVIDVDKEENIDSVKASLEDEFKENIVSLLSYNETLNDLSINQKVEQYRTIGSLFPIIFFAIVILMSFTTMYRLINKERNIIGTMKSLGFGNFKILIHYLSYSIWTSIIGTAFGVLIGWKIIPVYIWNFFEELFIFDNPTIVLDLNQVMMIATISILSTCIATIFVFIKIVKENPASLLRDRNTVGGKKTLIERIPHFWKSLLTSQKLVIRQIFSGKIRALMTIIGVLGCTGLLLCALGIRDTINKVASSVYDETYQYEEKIYLNEDSLTDEFLQSVNEDEKSELLEERMVFISTVLKNKSGIVHVIEDNSKYINFYENENRINLKEKDVLITEKTSEIYGLQLGDTLQFRGENGESLSLKVSHIVTVNVGQGIYLTKSTWESLNQGFQPTNIITKKSNMNYPDIYVKKIIETHQQKEDFLNSMNSTLSMSMLLILAASLLLLVVLYNLGILNFADRERNLATLAVLGFKFSELKIFLSVENIILSILGILFGMPVGIVLHQRIFANAGMGDELDFTPIIDYKSYIFTIAFTIILIVCVTYILNKKINKIKMVEALKSVE